MKVAFLFHILPKKDTEFEEEKKEAWKYQMNIFHFIEMNVV